MSINRSAIKERAKTYLQEPFSKVSMLAVLIYLAITTFGGAIPVVGSFAGIFAFIYYQNVLRMHYEMELFNAAPPLKRTFDFDGIGRIICGRLWAMLKMWPAYLLYVGGFIAIFVGVFAGMLGGFAAESEEMMLGGMLLGMLFGYLAIIAGAVLMVVLNLNYVLTEYILMDNPQMKALDGANLSKSMMKGHKGEWFVMILSFIGWDLLMIPTLGVLSIYVTPYKLHTFAGYYNAIKSNYNPSQC